MEIARYLYLNDNDITKHLAYGRLLKQSLEGLLQS